MKQKHIEASREARLWISKVIIPAVVCVALIVPKEKLVSYATNAKTKVKSFFKTK